jgi:hypothetical protein
MYSQATLGAANIALPRRSRPTSAIDNGKALAERTLIAFMFCSLVVMVMVLFDARLIHWFIVPVVLSGAIIGSDAVAFLQDRVEVMDPTTLVGTLGLHFFFLAPLLHVFWDSWTPYVIGPPEWRDWLGWMAILNLLGLLLYRSVFLFGRERYSAPSKYIWRLDHQRAMLVFGTLLVVSGLVQIWVYAHFGGISGFVAAYMEGEAHYGDKDPGIGFNGMGWIFMISESFPILSLFTLSAYLKHKRKLLPWPVIFAILAIYFVLVMLFGGLRGSRSNTIWALFWALGVIHFWIRKVTRSVVLVGLFFLVIFMYMYGFYKSVGAEALDAFQGSDTRDSLAHKTGRTLQGSILGDLARADIQALELYKMIAPPVTYRYALGRTYLGGISILIPRAIWPDRPPDKVRWTTELESGQGSYVPGVWQSSHVAGMAGEAMLNFGPIAAPFTYLVLALFIKRVRQWLRTLAADDSRWLMVPLVVMFTFILMASDSDNDVFFLFKYATVPLLAVLLSSRRDARHSLRFLWKS